MNGPALLGEACALPLAVLSTGDAIAAAHLVFRLREVAEAAAAEVTDGFDGAGGVLAAAAAGAGAGAVGAGVAGAGAGAVMSAAAAAAAAAAGLAERVELVRAGAGGG